MDPYFYRLVINAAFLFLNVFSCSILLFAWVSTRMRDLVVGLMAGAIFLSIFTSASNFLVSLLRWNGAGPESKNIILIAFKVVALLEPISMAFFYLALFLLSFRILRTNKIK